MIEFFNHERERFNASGGNTLAKDFVSNDPKSISWTSSLYASLQNDVLAAIKPNLFYRSVYRPYQKQVLYFDPQFIHRVGQMPRIFPNAEVENRVIAVSGKGSRNGVSIFMTNVLPDLNMLEAGAQCFPLHLYEEPAKDGGLFDAGESGLTKRDGITDTALAHFQAAYAGENISKEDLFYYIYGLLHCPAYRARFKNNLMKQLPRIPAVKSAVDFWAFSKAGRALADLHVNYENVEPYPVVIKEGDLRLASIEDPKAFYRVTKMKFGGKGKAKDQTTVIYNNNITMTEIPLRAYEYVVNGKPALSWVMERQVVKVDKASGIVNDANDYANETIGNPAYPLELFQRVITVSLETLDIVDGLPALDID